MTMELEEASPAQNLVLNSDDYYVIKAACNNNDQPLPFAQDANIEEIIKYAMDKIPITPETMKDFSNKTLLIPKNKMTEKLRCKHLVTNAKCDNPVPCYWFTERDHPHNEMIYERLSKMKREHVRLSLKCARFWAGNSRDLSDGDPKWLRVVSDGEPISTSTSDETSTMLREDVRSAIFGKKNELPATMNVATIDERDTLTLIDYENPRTLRPKDLLMRDRQLDPRLKARLEAEAKAES